MFLTKKWNTLILPGLLLSGLFNTNCIAQQGYDNPNVGLKYNQKTFSNQFPCGECAVFDNNGTDLRGFINSNKNDLASKAPLINEYSGNSWGYIQIKDAKVPSVDKKGDLNYFQAFDVMLGLYQTSGGPRATWWARECNSPKGPLVNIKVDAGDKLNMEQAKYTEMLHEMETKKITLIEYYNESYNQEDYDVLFKNYILMKNGTLKNAADYKQVIDYYNSFLDKFPTVSDPFLANKSFITCLTINNARYIGYFNVVNSKLAGHLEPAGLEYDKDREIVVNSIFKKLTGSVVYVYGDDVFGMDKVIIKYGHAHNIKLIRRKASDYARFNDIN